MLYEIYFFICLFLVKNYTRKRGCLKRHFSCVDINFFVKKKDNQNKLKIYAFPFGNTKVNAYYVVEAYGNGFAFVS